MSAPAGTAARDGGELRRQGLRQPLLPRRLRRSPRLIAAMALVSYLWTPYDVTELIVSDKLQTPSALHWFGTDHFGRDILSMIMVGARNSIAVALVAVGIGMGVGVPLGALAAARGGLVDEALMRLNDVVFAFPALLSAIMITAIFGPGAINAIIAIGIFNIPVFARVARAGALSLWPREFILAARAAGKGKALITIEHILPNIANLLLVQGTIQFALGILAEAGLSYVGLGAQPPMPSWGRMLFDAQTRMIVAPLPGAVPGLRHRPHRARPQPARRRPLRHARPQAETRAVSLLEIEKLSLAIGDTPILKGVDLAIGPGEVMGLVGESGSGKSMTALTIMRLLPDAARASGRVPSTASTSSPPPKTQMCALRGDDIGMVFQEPMTALNPVKTIGEQVAEGIRWHTGANRREAEERARKMLDRVGLPEAKFPLSRYPHELSGGQRQRVVIAIACALKPKLLIADEPTTALDVVLQKQILELLRDLVDENRMGLLLISHDLAVVDRHGRPHHHPARWRGDGGRRDRADAVGAAASLHAPARAGVDACAGTKGAITGRHRGAPLPHGHGGEEPLPQA